MKRKVIVDIVCALVILLFVYASFSKLIDFNKFKVDLGRSPLLTAFADYIAWFIPVIEIIISVMLTTNRFRLLGLYASFTLMVSFTAYIIAILEFSDYVPCSCGGILQNLDWGEHLIFNSVFILFIILGVLLLPSHCLTGRMPAQEKVAEGDTENL